jgi:hypothetical protein
VTNAAPRSKEFKDVTTWNQNLIRTSPPILKGVGAILAAALSDGSCCLSWFSNMAVRASGCYSKSSYQRKLAPRIVDMEYAARILGTSFSPSVSLFLCHFHATNTVYTVYIVCIYSTATQSQWPPVVSRGAAAAGLLLVRSRTLPCGVEGLLGWGVIVLSFVSGCVLSDFPLRQADH